MKGFDEDWLKQRGLSKVGNTDKWTKQYPVTPEEAFPNVGNYKGDIFIPGVVPSLKNSKRIFWKSASPQSKSKVVSTMNGRRVTPFITLSKQAKQYKVDAAKHYINHRKTFQELVKDLKGSVCIEVVPVLKTQTIPDFNNFNHIVTDMMVEHGWIADDNMKAIMPFPKRTRPHYYIDKENPGVWIKVLMI